MIKTQSPDPTLEAQVFWLRYRREIAALLVIAILALAALAGYRLYQERRETAAAGLLGSAKTAADYQEIIHQYGGEPAAAAAYLLLADEQRKAGQFAPANVTLQTFIDKFPRHELVSTARMAIAGNLEAMGKQDEAMAMYQVVASGGPGNFNAPQALLAQAELLRAKDRTEEARQVCENVMTQYRNSFAAMEAARLLRMLKPNPEPAKGGAATSPSPGPTASAAQTQASSPAGKP